jgi:hypothetical protein
MIYISSLSLRTLKDKRYANFQKSTNRVWIFQFAFEFFFVNDYKKSIHWLKIENIIYTFDTARNFWPPEC